MITETIGIGQYTVNFWEDVDGRYIDVCNDAGDEAVEFYNADEIDQLIGALNKAKTFLGVDWRGNLFHGGKSK